MFESDSLLFIAKCVLSTLVIVLASKVLRNFFAPYYLPGIPIMKANTILGFSVEKMRNGRHDSHIQMLELAEEKGKMFQYYWLGYHFVMINDKTIAKHVMKEVTGKGFFHVSIAFFYFACALSQSNFTERRCQHQ